MGEGRSAVAALVKTLRAWAPLVARDVTGLNASDFGDQPHVPDDVLSDAEQLLSVVDDAETPLAFGEALKGAIEPSYQSAVKEWREAEASDSTYQQLLARVRETGATFDEELQLFRRTLSSVVGRSDKDFQKLRAERATAADDEDDPAGPPATPPVAPAPPGQLEPQP